MYTYVYICIQLCIISHLAFIKTVEETGKLFFCSATPSELILEMNLATRGTYLWIHAKCTILIKKWDIPQYAEETAHHPAFSSDLILHFCHHGHAAVRARRTHWSLSKSDRPTGTPLVLVLVQWRRTCAIKMHQACKRQLPRVILLILLTARVNSQKWCLHRRAVTV